MTTGTGKVNMQLIKTALTIIVAYRIFHRAGTIVDTVNKQMLMKQRNGSRYG